MTVDRFLSMLQEGGHVIVGRDDPQRGEELERALNEMDAVARGDLAFTAPALSMPAAQWAAIRMYRACQFLVYREVEPSIIEKDLREPCPEAVSPSVCYSVDLSFRILPDL